MGAVADRIAGKFALLNRSAGVDLADWPKGNEEVFKTSFDDDSQDPCFNLYVAGQHLVSIMSEIIAEFREAKSFVRIYTEAEEFYLPQGPPMSPLTLSYFSMWSLFDVRFGRSRETIGTCTLRILAELNGPSWLVDVVTGLQQSRMGFYVHCGSEGEQVFLREVGTRLTVSCTVPAGYTGREGEIWFARLVPPPNSQCLHHIAFTTPYVIQGYPEQAFVSYLQREVARMKTGRRSKKRNAYDELMKFGPDLYHWNEYVLCAYSDFQREAVFLTGIPDLPETLPHAT